MTGAAAGARRRVRLHVRGVARSRAPGRDGRLDVPDALAVARTLKARDFIVDYRPPVGVRISPHFYNTPEEIDRITAEIRTIVTTGRYETGAGLSRVT